MLSLSSVVRIFLHADPVKFLRDFRGYLQADAYNGYDGLYLEPSGRIIEVGCWQHARKRFKEAQETDVRATCAMAFIKSLYAIEATLRERRHGEWRDLTIDERAARVAEVRTRETAPLLQGLLVWMRKTIGNVLPKTKLGEALRYTLNQWDALNQFTSCGQLDPDNNEAERAHCGIAIGRKNWSFVGSERGGQAAAVHFSFIASCKMNCVEPFTYLVDVLERLPTTGSALMPCLGSAYSGIVGGLRATRRPRSCSPCDGRYPRRRADRLRTGCPLQAPPRFTRSEASAGPVGSVTLPFG